MKQHLDTMFADAQACCLKKIENGGTTANCVLIEGGVLHVANVGDCRCVLSSRGVAIDLSSDHATSREDERDRIEAAGGHILYCGGAWRVDGTLNVTRSFGDKPYEKVLTAVPEVVQRSLVEEDEMLLIASDGVWKVISSQEAVDIALKARERWLSCNSNKSNSNMRDRRLSFTLDMQSGSPPKSSSLNTTTSGSPDTNTYNALVSMSDDDEEADNPTSLAELCSQMVVEEALRRSSRDNIACVVVFLDNFRGGGDVEMTDTNLVDTGASDCKVCSIQ